MKFDIATWWHWLFIFAATLGSAWAACRVFAQEYAASHNPILSPLFQFCYELAASFAGWMAMWQLLPFVATCTGPECNVNFTFIDGVLCVLAVIGIFGQIPTAIERSLSGLADLFSGSPK